MNKLEIRIATSKDARCIAELSRKTFYDTFADSNTEQDMAKFMNEQFSMDQLMEEVIKGEDIFYLAEEGEKAVGYIKLRSGDRYPEFGNEPTLEIARIYVDKSALGKGVGKLLMDQCIAVAESLQKKIIWLGVWEKNERAIKFYAKAGFSKFGEHDFVLGNDVQTDWLMLKKLGTNK